MRHGHGSRRHAIGVVAALPCGSLALAAAAPFASAEALREANARYYAAFSSRDAAALAAVWAQDAEASAIHPANLPPFIGWDAVRDSYRQSAASWAEFTIAMEVSQLAVQGEVGWVVGVETIRGRRPDGRAEGFTALATNVFAQRDGTWKLRHHHGSRLPQRLGT